MPETLTALPPSTQDEVSPRNSSARELCSGGFEFAAGKLAEQFPGLTPNMLTIGAAVGAVATDVLISTNPARRFSLGWARVAFTLMDGLDGALARKRQELGLDDKELSITGALVDTGCDKLQEVSINAALAATAWKKGDYTGVAIHAASGITSTWPATLRAENEARGNVVAEGFWGSRTGRFILNINALSINADRINPRLHQPISNTLGVISLWKNIENATQRYDALQPGSDRVLGKITDEEQIKSAKTRATMLKAINIGSTMLYAASATYKIRKRKRDSSTN